MSPNTTELLSKTYAPAIKARLSQFPSKDQSQIASWLIKTPVGTDYALQILEALEDLSRKEDGTTTKINGEP